MFAKAFRLFVSSTFQDFALERRLLQEQVLPVLEAHCAAHGFGFRAVDMRWGVNEDVQLDQRTTEICLGEVIDAKGYPAPNLLILIGDRYGWVPLPFAIARGEFETVRSWLAAQDQSQAVADLDRVYQLDENHRMPAGLGETGGGVGLVGSYTLRSREDDLLELKAPEAWAPVEARLRAGLQAAARQLHAAGELSSAGLEKYVFSLTEQEIRKGLEQLTAGDSVVAAHSIAWIRTTRAGEPPVRALADAVQQALPEGNVLHAEALVENESYGDAFIERIAAKLIAMVDAQIAEFKAREQTPDFALQTERSIHAAFAAERLRVFVGRQSNLTAIAAHIAGDARHPLVLTGVSGSGKTALMAQAAAQTKGAVVQRFVGASASSANQRNLLVSVIEDLAALGVATRPPQWEDDDNRFVNQVRDLLAAIDQPVTIFIDALDQLRAPYRPMWLSPQLNPKVKVVVSALDDEVFAAERGIVQGLRRSLSAEAFLAIEPLSGQDGADILKGLQREAQRGLTPDQQAFILERFQAAGASPLWLRIAFAIARGWRSTDDPRARGLADDVTCIIGQFFDELSTVHHHEPHLVRRALGLIAAGREGLSESEAITVLSADAEVMTATSSERFGARTDRLPDSVWVRLKRSLDALLVEKSVEGEPLLFFFHRQAEAVVRERFHEPDKGALHEALAKYFDPAAERESVDPSWTRRSLVELPFQLFHAGMRERLDALLTDPAWIGRKVQAFAGAREIVEDYNRFAKSSDRLQSLIVRTLQLCTGILARDPRQVMVQLHGRLIGAAEADEFVSHVFEHIPVGALHESCPALTPPGALLARFEIDGAVLSIAELPEGRLAVGSWDGSIRIWDALLGREVIRLVGHTNGVTSLSVLSDGKLASGSNDHTVRVWDCSFDQEVGRLEGHDAGVTSLVALPNGQIASGSRDKTIRLWSLADSRQTASLIGHEAEVTALAVLPDGRLASASKDKAILFWDLATGRVTTRILWSSAYRGYTDHDVSLAVLRDGRLVSASGDSGLAVWDTNSCREVASAGRPFDMSVESIAALSDNGLACGLGLRGPAINLLYSNGYGGMTNDRALVGHTSIVTALTQLSNGRLASGSLNGQVHVWDLPQHDDILVSLSEAQAELGRRHLFGDRQAVRRPLLISREERANAVLDTGTLGGMRGKDDDVDSLALLPDGRLAVARGRVELVDFERGKSSTIYEFGRDRPTTIAPRGDRELVCGFENGSIRIWDYIDGEITLQTDGHSGGITAIAIMDGERIASASYDMTIKIWDLKDGKAIQSFDIVGEKISHPIFDVDGGTTNCLVQLADGRLASGHDDGRIRIWGSDSSTPETLLGHDGSIAVLAVLPTGRLMSGSHDGQIVLWSPSHTRIDAHVLTHDSGVTALAIVADNRLVSATRDRMISLWDVDAGNVVTRLEMDVEARALSTSGDGQIVAGDRLGRVHRLSIKGVVGLARGSR